MGGEEGQSQTVPGKPQIKGGLNTIGRSVDLKGANYKHRGQSLIDCPRSSITNLPEKKVMYGCSGSAASEVLMHLSLKPYKQESGGKKKHETYENERTAADCEGVQPGSRDSNFSFTFSGEK